LLISKGKEVLIVVVVVVVVLDYVKHDFQYLYTLYFHHNHDRFTPSGFESPAKIASFSDAATVARQVGCDRKMRRRRRRDCHDVGCFYVYIIVIEGYSWLSLSFRLALVLTAT